MSIYYLGRRVVSWKGCRNILLTCDKPTASELCQKSWVIENNLCVWRSLVRPKVPWSGHFVSRHANKGDRLRIHILHVRDNYRPHQCTVCQKTFSQSSSLNKHLRVHSGDRPYKCPYCVKGFTASSILRTHIRQHSGEKPFKCRHCGRAFASHAAHDSHVRRNHR